MRASTLTKIRTVNEELQKGRSVTEACKKAQLSQNTYYTLRKKQPELFHGNGLYHLPVPEAQPVQAADPDPNYRLNYCPCCGVNLTKLDLC